MVFSHALFIEMLIYRTMSAYIGRLSDFEMFFCLFIIHILEIHLHLTACYIFLFFTFMNKDGCRTIVDKKETRHSRYSCFFRNSKKQHFHESKKCNIKLIEKLMVNVLISELKAIRQKK